MNSRDERTEQAVEAVMTEGRRIGRVPEVVRARMVARAGAYIQATSNRVLVPGPVLTPAAPWASRRLAFAAAALLAFSAAGAAAGLYAHGLRSSHAGAVPQPPQPVPAAHPSLATGPAAEAPPQVDASPTPERARRPLLSPQESYAAELSLLQHAHSEYNARAFRSTLALLAEHARRFPSGRLAEEREALRVRSLEGAGRPDEARRVLTAFGNRFPRSALLPRLREHPPTDP